MTEDEQADWIQQLLVSADVKELVECGREAEKKDKPKEGFVPSDE